MQTLDLGIIIFFLAAMAGYGIWQGRSNKTTGDYFLGGRNLPWIVAMFSIVATETSVLTFVSVPGLAFRGDWTFLQLAFGYILGRLLVSAVLLPVYFREGVDSIYEVIGRRFGRHMQKLASSVFLVTRILADGVRFLATAVVVEVVTGWPLSASVLIIGIVTLVYTLAGGIRTIVWIDSIQFVLYLFGGILTIAFIATNLDTGFAEALTGLAREGKLNVINPDWRLFSEPWAFFSAVTGGILLSFASHGVDYMLVQRVLGCKDLNAAKKAMIGSGFFVLLQFAVFLLAGSLIYLFLGDVPVEKDREFASFIVNHLPAGLKGLLLAGVLSAAMSTLSSSINSLASSTVTDLLGGRASLNRSRAISLGWAAVLIGIALLFDESDNAIVVLGLKIASFTYGGLLGLFLLSGSSRQFHPLSLTLGFVSGMITVFAMESGGIAWTWYIVFSVAVNLVVTVIVQGLLTLMSGTSKQGIPMNENTELKGLGGWLILVGIGVVLTPIRLLVTYIPIYKSIFEDGTWEMLTTVGSEAYDPLWAPLLIGEIVYNSIIVLVSLYLIYLFFSKHYFFPKLYIGIVAVSLIFIPLDAWLATKVLPDEPMFDPETTKEFLRILIGGIIWVPYILISKRVKATFAEKMPNKKMQPTAENVG